LRYLHDHPGRAISLALFPVAYPYPDIGFSQLKFYLKMAALSTIPGELLLCFSRLSCISGTVAVPFLRAFAWRVW